MDFTIERWKTEAKTKYRRLSKWLGGRAQDAGLAAYGALTTLTLWPLVEYTAAAAQTGQRGLRRGRQPAGGADSALVRHGRAGLSPHRNRRAGVAANPRGDAE